MLHFGPPRPRRKPSLTPMIDVVFLLLVFFMLAARFGQDVGLALAPAGQATASYAGPPRLVEFAGGMVWLNGVETDLLVLPDALAPLMPNPDALVILRPRDGASVQDAARLTDALRAAGLSSLVLMEP
ncbi:biopolymer transporter ExbD [Roseibaca sp. V10]|uniref:Biopolymer transporter ExbD n=1 Tax=Roseinatronobacter domitianus TaxID=2940293 RepID=A0ABT0M334_9RHOB|nr:biopolymer transporter ExbD [Roseibaca domitiana]MCL1628840.1 biopolymer transporter ExbD [Roseibaca domitiana]